ncbi:MAG: 2Fe-2S iron-sulfur cluster binding domain-containing protein [Gammaproteobacteria bacterium]|nr:2Fe-2S iron-sulfur cluster binding domain-containing protein [Gammaproteobacteria bacterium]
MNDGFTVKLVRQKTSVFVPRDGSILYSLLNAGIDVPYSCGSGICGACEQDVLSGVPEHRDFVLNEDEKASGKFIMICCSGSATPELELDL